uniref:Uncharacterized protein n=1 Tax=Uncultured archaeon GZfos26G2 TaxID=3386331 RepID=Q648M1_UNCAG|nr:hypothetical protein GZ37D1_3 [uncultured archaeon GZfos37D1]
MGRSENGKDFYQEDSRNEKIKETIYAVLRRRECSKNKLPICILWLIKLVMGA